MLINKILHASLLVRKTDVALDFYQGVLGMTRDPQRPELGYPGAWLNIGMQQIHLLELPNPDPTTGRPDHGGRDRHVAFAVSNLNELIERLDKADIGYTLSKSGRAALFCRDPDGNALEFIQTADR